MASNARNPLRSIPAFALLFREVELRRPGRLHSATLENPERESGGETLCEELSERDPSHGFSLPPEAYVLTLIDR